MAHFAKIENGVVAQVIVAEQDFIDTGAVGHGWIQTSYNTRGGIHYGQDGQPSGREQLRKNYAGVGFTYDEARDAFIPPQPFPSWALSEDTCLWDAPVAMPTEGGPFAWNEETLAWAETAAVA
tara:strand:- start:572 stop:940 length:369 start_codon:yes stop_codon:yes gene_type:complete